jgi:hypothetical protein
MVLARHDDHTLLRPGLEGVHIPPGIFDEEGSPADAALLPGEDWPGQNGIRWRGNRPVSRELADLHVFTPRGIDTSRQPDGLFAAALSSVTVRANRV